MARILGVVDELGQPGKMSFIRRSDTQRLVAFNYTGGLSEGESVSFETDDTSGLAVAVKPANDIVTPSAGMTQGLTGIVDELNAPGKISFIRRDDTGLLIAFKYTGAPLLAERMRVKFEIAGDLAISVIPAPASVVAAPEESVPVPVPTKRAVTKKSVAKKQSAPKRVNKSSAAKKPVAKKPGKKRK